MHACVGSHARVHIEAFAIHIRAIWPYPLHMFDHV